MRRQHRKRPFHGLRTLHHLLSRLLVVHLRTGRVDEREHLRKQRTPAASPQPARHLDLELPTPPVQIAHAHPDHLNSSRCC